MGADLLGFTSPEKAEFDRCKKICTAANRVGRRTLIKQMRSGCRKWEEARGEGRAGRVAYVIQASRVIPTKSTNQTS